jgi:hypothetical protein
MDIQETLDVLSSDMKLWEAAEKEDLGGGRLKLALDLPWGIGLTEVTLEGMNDAGAKRNALGSYGQYIRDLHANATSEDEISARARQRAALAEPIGGEDSVDGSAGVPKDTRPEKEAYEEAGGAYALDVGGPAGLGESLIARRAALVEEIEGLRGRLDTAERELEMIKAALFIYEEGDDT